MQAKTITLNLEELVFIVHLLNLQAANTTIQILKEAGSLKDLEETLESLIREIRFSLSASEDLIGNKRSVEICKSLLLAHSRILES